VGFVDLAVMVAYGATGFLMDGGDLPHGMAPKKSILSDPVPANAEFAHRHCGNA
jgi:hypothetical protein